jgi:2-polyprenyl-6-hydroxyphenyl methylase/3-demethylubiquinone-9 3-methyltransferase
MKAYYDAHESAYQNIKAKGYVGWGDKKSLADLGDPLTEQYLKATVLQWFKGPQEALALDLGCGTGTTAFTLAKLGFAVTGVDVSPTAIQIAQALSSVQNLKIDFKTADVLKLEALGQQFDLIYDSHCFHCIVFDEDRQQVLKGVKNTLRPGGKFILDTMISDGGHDYASGVETLRFDENYILWHKTKPSQDRGVVEVDGQHWCAQRRIYPQAMILEEVASAGFEILTQTVDTQGGQDVWMLRMVLGKL